MKSHKDGQSYRYASYKYDGHWLRVAMTAGGLRATTRRPTDITGKVKDLPCLAKCVNLMEGDFIDGELYVPGKPASYIKTAINSGDPALRFAVFNIGSLEVGKALEACTSWCDLRGLSFVKFVLCSGAVDALSLWQQHECSAPYLEGFVFCDGLRHGERKWKPTWTIDLVIDGFTEGKGKHIGLIGSIICKTHEGHEVAAAGGMTDVERLWFTEHAQECEGLVVEVAYQYVGSRGRLRHPRFVRMREDKQASECTCDQNSQLKEFYNDDQDSKD